MIEKDTGWEYLDEELWQVWDGDKALNIALKRRPCILQAPGLLKDVLKFNPWKAMIVVMKRDVQDIILSQERVGWNIWAKKELSNYADPADFPDAALWVAGAKYAYWETYLRDNLTYWEEVEYESLKSHSMWLDKKDREGFNARQYYRGQA
jgi:hypothetical protein